MSFADRIVQQSPVVRRTLAVLPLLAAVILVWKDVILPIHVVLTSQDRWRLHARTALAIARGQAAEAPNLQRQLNALPGAPIWQELYPDDDSANAATAIREDITHYAALAGATVRSIAPSPPTEQFGLRRLGVSISASMTIGQLSSFLTRLRESRRYLRVDALRVVAPQIQVTNANEHLLVELQVFGYARLPSRGVK
jgi:hypothetical protein